MNILIVDDDADIRYSFRRFLETEGHSCAEALSGEEAVRLLLSGSGTQLVIMDLRMGGITGLETLKTLREKKIDIPVIIMTAYGTTRTAIEAIKHGAYDYIIKPFKLEDLKLLIDKVYGAYYKDASRTKERLQGDDVQEGIIGASSAMRQVYKMIGKAASADATVLITGESGTGKELVARAVHRHSGRGSCPFVPVNCAAIPEALLESELFGHEKGAFTGAVASRRGMFEEAAEGVIFLDEIGDMSPGLQSKLLRVLQDGSYSKVGSSQALKSGARVIAATNKDLEKESASGNFRHDLYYRLNVVHIHVPALRERLDDIPQLVEYFINANLHVCDGRRAAFSEGAMAALSCYRWPGNVRELENTVKRALVMSTSSVITEDDLARILGACRAVSAAGEPHEDQLIETLIKRACNDPDFKIFPYLEEALINRLFEETHGNIQKTAKMLGLARNTLKKRMAGKKMSGGGLQVQGNDKIMNDKAGPR